MKGTKGLFRLGAAALALSFMVLAGCDNGTTTNNDNGTVPVELRGKWERADNNIGQTHGQNFGFTATASQFVLSAELTGSVELKFDVVSVSTDKISFSLDGVNAGSVEYSVSRGPGQGTLTLSNGGGSAGTLLNPDHAGGLGGSTAYNTNDPFDNGEDMSGGRSYTISVHNQSYVPITVPGISGGQILSGWNAADQIANYGSKTYFVPEPAGASVTYTLTVSNGVKTITKTVTVNRNSDDPHILITAEDFS